jgi:hypothetical protein
MPINGSYSETSEIVFRDGQLAYNSDPYLIDYGDIYSDYNPYVIDATNTSGMHFTALIDAGKLDSNMTITKGRYRFFVSNPSTLDFDFEPIAHSVNVDGTQKRFIVEGINYDLLTNEMVVTVNIIDNPIPLILIYAAVFAIIAAVGAVSVNSILTHIEKILDAPVIWPIVLIVGSAILIPLITAMNKT